MYYRRTGLGFSFKPPASVRSAFANIFGKVVSAGERAATSAIESRYPSAPSGPAAFVASVPGGMGTVAIAGVAAVALLIFMSRGRRG